MLLKLKKRNNYKRYKGLIIEPQILDFFIGRIWARHQTPFQQGKIEKYLQENHFKIKPAISENLTKSIFKRKSYICNRCLNENQNEFVSFECARCEKWCVYCRHCINMGRMSSCTELIVWNGPKPRLIKKHKLDWNGTFTNPQQRAANELIGSIKEQRNHIIHAVCGARQNGDTFSSSSICIK